MNKNKLIINYATKQEFERKAIDRICDINIKEPELKIDPELIKETDEQIDYVMWIDINIKL